MVKWVSITKMFFWLSWLSENCVLSRENNKQRANLGNKIIQKVIFFSAKFKQLLKTKCTVCTLYSVFESDFQNSINFLSFVNFGTF